MADGEVSEFNMAIEFLRTIRAILTECDKASSSLDMPQWYNSLLILRRELSDDMTEKQLETSNYYKNLLHKPIQVIQAQMSKGKQPYINQQIYNQLDSYEMFLRKIISDKGYKGKMKDSAFFALR